MERMIVGAFAAAAAVVGVLQNEMRCESNQIESERV